LLLADYSIKSPTLALKKVTEKPLLNKAVPEIERD
jgi:hypothetical protein